MPQRRGLRPVGDLVVRYSAEEMPVTAIEEIRQRTVSDLKAGEIASGDALRITDLLLVIALRKLKVAA